MYRIFIVEDDAVIAAAVAKHLESWGYSAVCVRDFEHVLDEFSAAGPQLVLMDVSLPFYNGYHWCSRIRQVSKVPVIFLSSAADNLNIVMAMNLGGDDFIAKPFDLQVLAAKVQALLRRTYDFGAPGDLLPCGSALLDLSAGALCVGDERVELTKNETRILQMLIERRGQVVSRSALMTRLWQSDSYIDENTLTVNVARLRKKLEAAGLEGLIRTKKGEGYLMG